MSFQYLIHPQPETILVVANGAIDEMSIVQAILEVASNPDFVPTDKVIVDLRNMEYQPSPNVLFSISDRLASLKNKFQGEIKVVVQNTLLYQAHLACIMAKTAGINMNTVSEY